MRATPTIIALFVLMAVLPPLSYGQGTSAALTGLITDSSQAVIQGATVKATNFSTNVTRGTTTDAGGSYQFPSLPVGEYEVTVEHPGFAPARQRLQIDTAEHARQDFTLAVAGSAQEVTVNATAAELSPDDASLSTTIASATVTSTPLYLRQWDDLIRLVPGVQANPYTDQNGATSAGRTGGFNVHGIHSLQNNFLLDGIDDNSISENVQELTTEVVHPSVDTIQEFRVITNPYSAEFGRSPGATVAVTTKSGTNGIHGLLLEYLRNRVFDANDFFSNKNGLAKP